MKKLLALPTDMICKTMPFLEKYIKNALETGIGETSWETLLGKALLGNTLFWLAFDDGKIVGAASTEILDFDGYRCVHLITSGIDKGFLFEDYHHVIEDHAKSVGARNVQFWGRKGWSRAIGRVTGQSGEKYEEVYRVFSMEIDYEKQPTEPDDAIHDEQLRDSAS